MDESPQINTTYQDRVTQVQQDRQKLPIYNVRGALLNRIYKHDSLIVLGETACGKTTQIPQYIYEENLNHNKCIACTQPRRVAAISVAHRVAQEMSVNLGDLVGYTVRFDDTTVAETKIKYMTDGMLLREAIRDPLLKWYSVIILDEAHERTVHTDVLFGVVKRAQGLRSKEHFQNLKIIVMSATMDVDHFSEYFSNAPVLYIEGRQHPVKIFNMTTPSNDYVFNSLVTVFNIHQQEPLNEDILVFLTGQEEIESAVTQIKKTATLLPAGSADIVACPLYASLPYGQQMKTFQPAPQGKRKVIIATNIAETSVTIKGVVHVIDTGKVKAKTFNPDNGLDLLKVQSISQAQAWQRTGRAGRQCPGVSYRLYTHQEFEDMQRLPIPEILRCNLGSVCLQLMALGVPDVANFDFMDKPSPEYFNCAFHELKLLGAVTEDQQLTPLGRQMAEFPLDPKLSKIVLSAKIYGCAEEILTIVSILSCESILSTPQEKREEAVRSRQKFFSPDGDHMMYLNVYRGFKSVSGNKRWCLENFINFKNMSRVQEIRRQLKEICGRLDIPNSSSPRDTTAIRKCIAAGFFMDAAELQTGGEYLTISTKKTVEIHPSSCLFQCKPAYVIYNQLTETTKCYMRDLCTVDPQWLFDIAPSYFKRKLRRN